MDYEAGMFSERTEDGQARGRRSWGRGMGQWSRLAEGAGEWRYLKRVFRE